MNSIQMVDLVGQHARIQDELDAALLAVSHAGTYIKGPDVDAFAEELAAFTGARHILPCANGTDALQLALMALDIGPGDEVITTGFTFIATIEVVALLGARPVLVDVHADTFNIDVEQVRAAITPRTRAIVPVHLFGQMADMDALLDLSRETGVPIIEDNAQAISARWYGRAGKRPDAPQAGTLGHLGTTSFFPSKNLGCMGDGGAVMTSDDNLAERVRMFANHGMKVRYYHDTVGINSRLDTLQASVLRVKLRHLDHFVSERVAAADRYDGMLRDLAGVRIPFRDPRGTHVFHQYTLTLDPRLDRDGLVKALAAAGIPSAVYYPVPGHRQRAFAGMGLENAHCPVSDALSQTVISLPMHTELNQAQQARVCEEIANFVNA
jgi:UDP-2-acetamido-2-deoxy-ribo-hexuluronate aminotransferase